MCPKRLTDYGWVPILGVKFLGIRSSTWIYSIWWETQTTYPRNFPLKSINFLTKVYFDDTKSNDNEISKLLLLESHNGTTDTTPYTMYALCTGKITHVTVT